MCYVLLYVQSSTLTRCSCVLQLKQMEVQLEEEYEDKQKVLRDKRELECKLLNTQDQVLPSLNYCSLLVLLNVNLVDWEAVLTAQRCDRF